MALEITDSNFDETVRNSGKVALVDFWAEWCGPCKMAGPVIDEIAKDYDGKAVVGKISLDDNAKVSSEFGIRSIPCFILFKDGQEVKRVVGFDGKTKAKLVEELEQLLK